MPFTYEDGEEDDKLERQDGNRKCVFLCLGMLCVLYTPSVHW